MWTSTSVSCVQAFSSANTRWAKNGPVIIFTVIILNHVTVITVIILNHVLTISSLWVSRTGSASDWCALQEALYKCIDTIQYDTIQWRSLWRQTHELGQDLNQLNDAEVKKSTSKGHMDGPTGRGRIGINPDYQTNIRFYVKLMHHIHNQHILNYKG